MNTSQCATGWRQQNKICGKDQIHIETMPTNNLNNKNFLIILILIILLLFMVIKDNRYKLLKLSSHDFNNISEEIWSAFLSNIKSEGWD